MWFPNGDKSLETRLDFFTARRRRVILLVTMKGSDDLLHSICVVNREGVVFYDSLEPYAMRLLERSLNLCVHDYASYRGLTDLRKVFRSASRDRVEKKRKSPSSSERKECSLAVEGTYKYIKKLLNTLKFS